MFTPREICCTNEYFVQDMVHYLEFPLLLNFGDKNSIMKWITVGTFRKKKSKLVNIVDQILAHRQKAKGFYKKVLAKFPSY